VRPFAWVRPPAGLRIAHFLGWASWAPPVDDFVEQAPRATPAFRTPGTSWPPRAGVSPYFAADADLDHRTGAAANPDRRRAGPRR
jgi:hypothetical protein